MVDHLTFLTIFLGIFFGAAILLAVVVFAAKSRSEKSMREHELALERINMEKERARKEIIMIPCRYCGGSIPQASAFCPNCGARRTA
jgi:rubrerythrin